MTALAANCANLTTINLSICDKITDAAITALAANCANLTTIDLMNCEQDHRRRHYRARGELREPDHDRPLELRQHH